MLLGKIPEITTPNFTHSTTNHGVKHFIKTIGPPPMHMLVIYLWTNWPLPKLSLTEQRPWVSSNAQLVPGPLHYTGTGRLVAAD